MRRLPICVLAFSLLAGLTAPVAAQTVPVTLAWDASADTDIAGYTVSYGVTPGQYSQSIAVGPVTEYALRLPPDVTYYVAVSAYTADGRTSSPSNEIVVTPRIADVSRSLILRNTATGALARWDMVDSALGGDASLRGVSDLNWRPVGTGDFNADDNTDIVWQHRDGWISVWLMQENTVLDGRLFVPDRVADVQWKIVGVADMDDDGHQDDLLWQHANGSVAVWLMNGTALQDGHLLDPGQVAAPEWKIAGAGDFNGDRRPDLLFRHETQGALAVWFMSGSRMYDNAWLVPSSVPDTQWKIVAVTDMNGDGRADIIWQHDNGRLAVWKMNGVRLTSGEPMVPDSVADTNWRIVGGR